MPFPAKRDELTDACMKNPKVGDCFTEIFAFWVFVLKVTPNFITIIEASAPAELPKDGKVTTMTREAFIERFSYGNIEGYWITISKRGQNVDGWLEYHESKREYDSEGKGI